MAYMWTIPNQAAVAGTRDGKGAGDCDQPYTFGRRPTLNATYPFSTRQYAQLLVLRGRVQDGLVGRGDTEADGLPLAPAPADGSAYNGLWCPCATCGRMVLRSVPRPEPAYCTECRPNQARDTTARTLLFAAGVLSEG